MKNLNVEDEIKKHYLADDGMWLVEKGKIKEAKLLKEAHERILWLRGQYNHYYNEYNKGYQSSIKHYVSERDQLQIKLEEQKKINKRLLSLISGIKETAVEISLLEEKCE